MRIVKWFAPYRFVGWQKTGDVREWGFRFDFSTEITYYTYDWGTGWTFVVLGFGVEVSYLPDLNHKHASKDSNRYSAIV